MGAGDAGAMPALSSSKGSSASCKTIRTWAWSRSASWTTTPVPAQVGKHDVKIHGVPVLGDRHAIPKMAARYRVKLVIIAMPTMAGKTIREIVKICEDAGLQTKIVPGLYELIGGAVSVRQLREVQIEDLLRREPVQTDIAAVQELLRGKRVLVTGGGGSIGAELCRQILGCRPASLIVLGHGENSIFEISEELKAQAAAHDVQLVPVIHVPLMESNPGEAITNPVLRPLLSPSKGAVEVNVTSHLLNLPTSHLLNLSHLGKLNNMERKADTFCF
ncbi:MAG: hypothetical protein CVU38_19565 [Chloroflexi bacterium HGW-Chloroflexi-1]|nr:MAG: hypothetical protein CVU38_19565 [Chloroflexi bacterium HGW-Chloroflexi-1]